MNKSNIGVIYITNEGNIGFDFNGKHYEVLGFPQLTELKSVIEYDKNSGFLMIDTNYGEEFFEFFEEVDISESNSEFRNFIDYFSSFLRRELSKVDKFIIDKNRNQKKY